MEDALSDGFFQKLGGFVSYVVLGHEKDNPLLEEDQWLHSVYI